MNAGDHFPIERNKLGDEQIKTKSTGRNIQAYGSARFISSVGVPTMTEHFRFYIRMILSLKE